MAIPQTQPFGQVITAGAVRSALRTTLVDHCPPVLEVLAVRAGFGPGAVAAPIGWGAGADPGSVVDRPMGVVVCPGISEQPRRRATGLYELGWDAAAAVVVAARSRDEAQALSEVHGAALRATVLQHPGLDGGLAASTRWVDERHEEIAYDSGRSVWAATVLFAVTTVAAVDGHATVGPNPVVTRHVITVSARGVLDGMDGDST